MNKLRRSTQMNGKSCLSSTEISISENYHPVDEVDDDDDDDIDNFEMIIFRAIPPS